MGRVLGIEVFFDSSWILLFGLVTSMLFVQLQDANPDWTSARAFVAGLVGSALLVASILLHELGHCFVSTSLGLRVKSVTLYLFGGLSQLAGEPKRPRDAFLVAVAGPMVSLLLFAFFLAASFALRGGGAIAETAQAVCESLAGLNFLLVAFNSVPGLPLDGGHVLRALVWAISGSKERGTRAASGAGVLFALLLIGLGIVVALQGGLLGGACLAFGGWFLLRNARSIGVQLYVRRHLERIRLADALHERSTASRWSSVEDIQDLVGRIRRPVFIVDGEDLLGWVTPEQVSSIAPKKRAFTPVSSILVPVKKLIGLDKRRTLLDALSLMNENGLREVAVFEGGHPIGAVTRDELVRILREGLDRGRASAATS